MKKRQRKKNAKKFLNGFLARIAIIQMNAAVQSILFEAHRRKHATGLQQGGIIYPTVNVGEITIPIKNITSANLSIK